MTKRVSIIIGVAVLAAMLGPALASAELVGFGSVVGVNWPGDGEKKDFLVANDDKVSGGHGEYTPEKDTKWVKGGEVYNLLMVTRAKSFGQLFVVFSGTGHEKPMLEDILKVVNTVVKGVGTTNESIQEGDSVEIRTQPAKGSGTDVTLDVKRGARYVATFSFVQK